MHIIIILQTNFQKKNPIWRVFPIQMGHKLGKVRSSTSAHMLGEAATSGLQTRYILNECSYTNDWEGVT